MRTKFKAPWLFVIDTEDYAGNFERELCAYITGRIGDCGVGDDMAEIFQQEVGSTCRFDNVVDEDEEGILRPTSIYTTPGWLNSGFGDCYKIGDEAAALIRYRKASAAHYRNSLAMSYLTDWLSGDKTRKDSLKEAGWTEESLRKSVAEDEKEAKKAEKTKTMKGGPAYNSVAISFESRPAQKQIDLMKERAEKFAKLPHWHNTKEPRISKIVGYRVIENVVKRSTKEEAV